MTLLKTILLFGGRSAEHEVSVLSARSVAAAAPAARVQFVPICIGRDGKFLAPDRSARVLAGEERAERGDAGFSFELWADDFQPDLVFPLTHGAGGEDGTLQGYLETLGLPYVGSGVTASAIGMDKAHMKHAFAVARLPIVEYVPVSEHDWLHERERVSRAVTNALRLPYFVKPANGGSSAGITKVKNDADLGKAMETAFRFDSKALVERGIDAREIEVAILGNDKPQVSVPGEIFAAGDFYDYRDKYLDNRASLGIPAKLAGDRSAEIQKLALAAFRSIGAAGLARVDFFIERGTNRLYLNEINTLPGFTEVSMYPKLWEATELKYTKLLEKLIDLGLERSADRARRRASAMEWLEGQAKLG